MGTVLPFSSFYFFMLSFGFIAFLYILKYTKLSQIIAYKYILFIAIIVYIHYCIPHASSNAIFFFLLYTYFIYWIFVKNNYDEILFPMVVIALPMILYKFDVGSMYKIIGISYITFRSIQAMVDSKNYGSMSFVEFTSFLLFPTTLLAGPIDRSYRFKEDLEKGYTNLTLDNALKGWELLMVGILFKFIFAEAVDRFWLSNSDAGSKHILDMINSGYAYTTYLYFDFAGYSAMAVGLSIMVGIFVPINFNQPYLAPNPQDFWRRFHITLGSWLTDYFFKPLYKYLHGFKILKGRRLLIQNISIISTFLLMGMWNGLTWYYIFSGFLFGLYSAIHNSYVLYVKKGGYDIFTYFPAMVSINLKRFLMINAAVLALYFFSGRVPI